MLDKFTAGESIFSSNVRGGTAAMRSLEAHLQGKKTLSTDQLVKALRKVKNHKANATEPTHYASLDEMMIIMSEEEKRKIFTEAVIDILKKGRHPVNRGIMDLKTKETRFTKIPRLGHLPMETKKLNKLELYRRARGTSHWKPENVTYITQIPKRSNTKNVQQKYIEKFNRLV